MSAKRHTSASIWNQAWGLEHRPRRESPRAHSLALGICLLEARALYELVWVRRSIEGLGFLPRTLRRLLQHCGPTGAWKCYEALGTAPAIGVAFPSFPSYLIPETTSAPLLREWPSSHLTMLKLYLGGAQLSRAAGNRFYHRQSENTPRDGCCPCLTSKRYSAGTHAPVDPSHNGS